MSDQTAGHRRRRGASPLDNDDLLSEILLRVPPQPSSLPRASLVCKHWGRIVSDPWFLRRFRIHHQKAPLLGFFEYRLNFQTLCPTKTDFVFSPVLELSDRIPPQRFSLGWEPAATAPASCSLLSCRHGRVIFLDSSGRGFKVFVCDPLMGSHLQLDVPPEFTNIFINGTVLCTAGEQGHVHGACHSGPFKVVMVSMSENDRRPKACVYSSETGLWGNIIWHDHPCRIVEFTGPSTLIGHALYWVISFGSEDDEDEDEPNGVLEFDMERHRLAVLKGPPTNQLFRCWAIKAMNGGVGLATWPYRTMQLQLWYRNVNCQDGAPWVLFKTFNLYDLFGIQEHERWPWPRRRDGMLGYDEDGNVIFICVDSSLFLLQLDSMQFKRHYERIERKYLNICHPFRSFLHLGDSGPHPSLV